MRTFAEVAKMILSLLKKAVPVPKIEALDSFLFVGPHPDDIEVACGGTVAKLASSGKKITFLIVTNGCVGSVDENLQGEELVRVRREEALQSAKMLNVSDVRFLPYNDGNDYDFSKVMHDVVKVMLEVRPQMVFCPDYTVPSECHPDHLNVGKIVTESVFRAGWKQLTARLGLIGNLSDVNIAYYYTHKPNCNVGVRKTSALHLEAIACHKSQFTKNDLKSFKLYFTLREIRFGLRCCKGRAEGFRVLSPTQQHCFPEASEF